MGLDINDTIWILAYVDDNLTGDDIRPIERNGDVLLNACKYIWCISKHSKDEVEGSRITGE